LFCLGDGKAQMQRVVRQADDDIHPEGKLELNRDRLVRRLQLIFCIKSFLVKTLDCNYTLERTKRHPGHSIKVPFCQPKKILFE